jgi:hypothetical protein
MSGLELLLILAGVVGVIFYLIDEHTTQQNRREVRPYYWPMRPQEPGPSGPDGTESQTE